MSQLAILDLRTVWRCAGFVGRCYGFLIRHLPRVRGRTRLLIVLSSMLFRGRIPLVNRKGVRLVVDPIDYIGEMILTKGEFSGVQGGTNSLQILTVHR